MAIAPTQLGSFLRAVEKQQLPAEPGVLPSDASLAGKHTKPSRSQEMSKALNGMQTGLFRQASQGVWRNIVQTNILKGSISTGSAIREVQNPSYQNWFYSCRSQPIIQL